MRVTHAFDRWLYRGGRPNRLARLLNRGWAIAYSAGLWPRRVATLEASGRRTGRIVSFPVVIADHEGERYLVAMLGEESNWPRNVRAAGGRAVLRHGRREAVRLDEVDPAARPPILRRYLALAPGARAHIPVDRNAPIGDFEKIAAQVPVFHITTDRSAPISEPCPRDPTWRGSVASTTVRTAGWDGSWFRRAYDYFGRPVGSAENEEG